jgi:hypothetical protein
MLIPKAWRLDTTICPVDHSLIVRIITLHYIIIQLTEFSLVEIDNLHVRLIFYLGKQKQIPVKNLLKLVKLQNLVAKCCKIQKI